MPAEQVTFTFVQGCLTIRFRAHIFFEEQNRGPSLVTMFIYNIEVLTNYPVISTPATFH